MGQIALFIAFILLIAIYPLLIKYNNSENKTIEKDIPKIEIFKGNYKIYNLNLEKYGVFEKAVIKGDIYKVNSLYLVDKVKKYTFTSDLSIAKTNLIYNYNALYKDNNKIVFSVKAIYDKNKDTLRGEEFQFFSDSLNGRGKRFLIDKKRFMYAKDIDYVLKVDK